MSNQDLFKGTVEPSFNTIAGYVHAVKTIQEKYPIAGELSMSELLELPNVFTVEEKNIDDASKQLILDTTSILVKEMIVVQEKEGAALQKDIEQRIATMQSELATIEKASAVLMTTQKEKVQKTLQEVNPDQASLMDIQKHAAYVLLDKMDINEELVRFKSHLKSLTSTLTSADIEKGKRLDFILQEMAREINTIAAKCSDATIGSHAINIKVELEKAREQTQNIV